MRRKLTVPFAMANRRRCCDDAFVATTGTCDAAASAHAEDGAGVGARGIGERGDEAWSGREQHLR
jgi:hypothetical protein